MRKSRSGKEEVIREEERNAERNTERNTERTKKKAKHEGQREGQIKYLPAILSVLFFFAVIEICFYFGLLRLQEAGGLFFLVTAVEVLIIKYRKKKKEKRRKDEESWDDEDEVYRMLQEEMYELQDKPQDEAEEIQETRCLIPSGQDDGVLLVCRTQTGTEHFPDIHLGTEPLYIGKKKGESDVLLDSPTVSRLHARLELQQGRCLVRDLNSKNGTFVNGDRLRPQEQRELVPGDRIAFAEVEYYFTRNQ
jgi:hypothetical protein